MSDSHVPIPADESAWRRRVEEELGDTAFDETLTATLPGGIVVEPLYTRHDRSYRRARRAPTSDIGWHICPLLDSADPEVVNQQVLADLDGGASALWLRLDLAARAGVDADDLAAGSLAGRDGLAAYHLGDLDVALSGVRLDAVPLLLDAGANALPAAAGLLGVLESRGVDCSDVELHLGSDPLGALATDGRVPASFENLKVEMRQLSSFCAATLPTSTAVTVSDLPWHHAGGSTVTELGLAAATLVTYLRWMESEGWEPHRSAPHILLRVAVDRELFPAVAKLRAARLLWDRILATCGLDDPPPATIHAVVSDRPFTARDPWVNMLRATSQTLAAVVGGADLVTTPPWDGPLGPASANGRRLARNTHSILGEESALGQVLDPAGGSHFVEELTGSLARGAWDVLREIENRGGVEEALGSGWVGQRLEAERQARRAAILEAAHPITGVTTYANADEELPSREPVELDAAADRAAQRMRDHRGRRTEAPDLELACVLDRMAVWVRMAVAGATMREISVALRRSCCETLPPLPRVRDAEALE